MSQQSQRGAGGRLAVTPKRVVVALLGILALVVIFQNSDQARVHVLAWQITAPGWVWLLGMFLVGVAVGSVFPWFRRKG